MDGLVSPHRLVLPQFVSPEECKELEFIHKSCGVVGYRPWVLSTTLCHLVATNCANLILPILPIRERVKEIVEEHFGREYELFTEFTGLISWTKGAKIGWHSDDNRPYLKQRHYSAVCYLNNYGEDFDGGLFRFEEGDPHTILPTAGTIVIYTADEKNMHSVDEIAPTGPDIEQFCTEDFFLLRKLVRITYGERCTLALWFTLDKAHDEDEKLIQQLSALNSDFGGVMSEQNSEKGRFNLGLPVSASSVMYNLNGSVQQDEDKDKNVLDQSTEEIPFNDLRVDRMTRRGFTCCFPSVFTSDEQDQPVEVLYMHKEVPCKFSSMMHALQVIQFHQFRRSILRENSSNDEEEASKVFSRSMESSIAEDIFGDKQARHNFGDYAEARLNVGSRCNVMGKSGRESRCIETDMSEVDDFIESWKLWEAYSSNLWNQVYRFLPLWKASRLLVIHI